MPAGGAGEWWPEPSCMHSIDLGIGMEIWAVFCIKGDLFNSTVAYGMLLKVHSFSFKASLFIGRSPTQSKHSCSTKVLICYDMASFNDNTRFWINCVLYIQRNR